MIAHAALAALAIGFSGAALVAWGLRSGSAAFRFAVGLALGLGTWAASAAAEWLIFDAHGTSTKDAMLAVAGAGAWLIARPAREPEPLRPPAPRWLLALFAVALALNLAVYLEHSIRFPDGGWDAWMTWNLRARFLYRDPHWHDAFSPHLLFWAHPEYPWLLPGVVAQIFHIFGESYTAPALSALLFGALTCAVLSLRSLAGGLVLLATPCFVVFAANQYSDMPLALFLLLAVALLRQRAIWLSGFAIGLAAWTKYEGAVWLACLLLGLLLRDRKALLPFLIGALPGITVLLLFKLVVKPPDEFFDGHLLARLFDPQRWLQLAVLSIRRIFYFQNWAMWLVAAAIALGLRFRQLLREPAGIALLLAVPAIAGIYLSQPFALDWIFRTSIDRLLMQWWPCAILLLLPATPRT